MSTEAGHNDAPSTRARGIAPAKENTCSDNQTEQRTSMTQDERRDKHAAHLVRRLTTYARNMDELIAEAYAPGREPGGYLRWLDSQPTPPRPPAAEVAEPAAEADAETPEEDS